MRQASIKREAAYLRRKEESDRKLAALRKQLLDDFELHQAHAARAKSQQTNTAYRRAVTKFALDDDGSAQNRAAIKMQAVRRGKIARKKMEAKEAEALEAGLPSLAAPAEPAT